MAEFNKKAIPELPDIENYLDSTDQFIVFDNRESTSDSKARKVTYEKIKNGIIADIPETEAEIKGIDYHIEEDEDNPLNSVLRIIYDDFTSVASTDKAGLMSTEDKTNLNNLEDGFNSKVLLGRDQSNWSDLININKIQGANGVWTDIEDIEGEKILKISVPSNQYSTLEIKNGNNYAPIDKLDLGQELFTEKIENNAAEYKLKIDVEELKRQGIGGNITAQVNGEEININKIISGENVSFQTDIDNPSNLIISSTGSSVDPTPTPEPTPSTKASLAYTCSTENTSINKVIETEDVLEEGEIFTVYFENGFSNDNRIQSFTLTIGQQNKPIIFNESDRFSSYIINKFATFVKKEEGYFLISADADLGKGIRTSAPNSNGTESLYLYDNTPYTFINDLSEVQINNNQLNIFDENGIIRTDLLPNGSGEGSDYTPINYNIGETSLQTQTGEIPVNNLPDYILKNGNIVGIRFLSNVTIPASLNINNTGAFPIIYQNSYDFENNFIKTNTIGFFIFNGSSYVLLTVDNLINFITTYSNSGIVTTINQNGNSYNLINSNIIDNDQKINSIYISDNYAQKSDLLTNNNININLLSINGNDGISVTKDRNSNSINIGIDFPSTSSAGDMYLSGDGTWATPSPYINGNAISTINGDNSINVTTNGNTLSISLDNSNLEQTLRQSLINNFYPLGTYYYTSDENFNPNGNLIPGVTSPVNWTSGGLYIWEKSIITENNQTVYRWHKIYNPNYTP